MEKYGFVYIWRDKGKDRYYIGRHWGTEEDGYICSSMWMRNSYRRRPQDFRRKILKTHISNKQELIEEENKWLSLIKKKDLKNRYYNMYTNSGGPWKETSSLKGIPRSEEVKEKISLKHKGKILSEEHKKKLSEAKMGKMSPRKGKIMSEEQKEKLRFAWIKRKEKGLYSKVGHCKGRIQSEEEKLKRSESMKGKNTWMVGKHNSPNTEFKKGLTPWNKNCNK